MFRRIGLFLITNILVVATIGIVSSIVMRLMGVTSFGPYNLPVLMVFCTIWGFGGALISLMLSKWMAKMMYGVQILNEKSAGEEGRLVARVHQFARKAGLKVMPEVGVYTSPELNAFATGPSRSNSLVAVSSGLLNRMDDSEVDGVLAHEIAHIANGDMVTMTLIQGVVNAFVMFFARIVGWSVAKAISGNRDSDEGPSPLIYMAVVFVLDILFGILGSIVTSAFSRWREFRADRGGAEFAGREKMIRALTALQRFKDAPADENLKGVASLKISNKPSALLSLFSTHPALEDRIRRLQRGL